MLTGPVLLVGCGAGVIPTFGPALRNAAEVHVYVSKSLLDPAEQVLTDEALQPSGPSLSNVPTAVRTSAAPAAPRPPLALVSTEAAAATRFGMALLGSITASRTVPLAEVRPAICPQTVVAEKPAEIVMSCTPPPVRFSNRTRSGLWKEVPL